MWNHDFDTQSPYFHSSLCVKTERFLAKSVFLQEKPNLKKQGKAEIHYGISSPLNVPKHDFVVQRDGRSMVQAIFAVVTYFWKTFSKKIIKFTHFTFEKHKKLHANYMKIILCLSLVALI